jgi:hypothetical protein
MAEKKGVLLAALCELGHKTLCYAWSPADASEAERHLMPQGVKFSAPVRESSLRVVVVGNPLKWLYLRLRYRREQRFKQQLFG